MIATRRIYLDHNASTPLAPEALAAMMPLLVEHPANPASVHSDGRAAARTLEDARRTVASRLGARPSEIVFTSGGTEALNLAIRGTLDTWAPGTRPHVVISSVEHPAVRAPCLWLAERGAISLTVVAVDRRGRVDPDAVAAAVGPETALVATMLVNNELGNRSDVAAIAAGVHAANPQTRLLTDAVQAVGRIPVDVRALGVDLLALSGHKLGGPRGVGALVVRTGRSRLEPLVRGGGQESERRGGTPNVAGIAGLAAACELPPVTKRLADLEAELRAGLRALVPDLVEHGDPVCRAPGTVSLGLDGVDAEELLLELDLAGIAASSGSACASGTRDPSHVLLALGLEPAQAHASIRLSLGRTTTREEIARVLEVLPRLVARLRA